jgi:hypothetical protein
VVAETAPKPKKKPTGLIQIEEWIKFMRRTFNVIDTHLGFLEARLERNGSDGKGRNSDGVPFEPADIRAMQVLTNTFKTVRVINEDIREEQLSEDAKQQLAATRAQQEDLQRRLDRLAKSGEEA